FWHHGQYGALPFLALYTSGFLTVGALTLLHTATFTPAPLEAADPVRGASGAGEATSPMRGSSA
ncbi:MAG: hypothetical protein HY613_05540, partial [Candidatus Rokubacteria bacterium]|nr:hypothetical protein [Candidatus Rokubacteria bacterium]